MGTTETFNVAYYTDEFFALTVAVLNFGQETIKMFFRNRLTIVEMDGGGIFDRRIMKQKLLWGDVEWIDPQPAGLPDRLRVMGKAELTAFGQLRNCLIRTIRRLPKGEIAITFGGLDKAGAQAATWLADHNLGSISPTWKSIERTSQVEANESDHNDPLISAGVYWRSWVGAYVSFTILVALLAALLPALLLSRPGLTSVSDANLVLVAGLIVALCIGVWTALFHLAFWLYQKQGDQLVVISRAGFSDARISSDFVPWQDVESVSFELRDSGRLINEARSVVVQLREGLMLPMPKSKLFWVPELFRRATTPEMLSLGHQGTTTSVSEIIETIQRHNLPVSIRETARG